MERKTTAGTRMFPARLIVELMAANSFSEKPDIQAIKELVFFMTSRIDNQAAKACRFYLLGQLRRLQSIASELSTLRPVGGMFMFDNSAKLPLLKQYAQELSAKVAIKRLPEWVIQAIDD